MGENEPRAGRGDGSAALVFASVRETARANARDRYLAALLAPRAVRDDLVVLAAYAGEVARIPLIVREPQVGEIRLQWWRDALDDAASPTGNPVADAMAEVARRRALPRDLLLAPLEARSRELYEDGVRDGAALDAYARDAEGAPLKLALAILDADAAAGALVHDAARALALTRLALSLPYHIALGRLPLPHDMILAEGDPRGLDEHQAGEAVGRLNGRLAGGATAALARFRAAQARCAGLSPAFLPLSLVPSYLRAVLAPKRDALREPADISPLSRVMRLWFARWRGSV
jgi:phytoene synthase